ncbi:MAG: SusC/RagA family TonB-linked outer membrane protein [Gemmatimonadota bacterium]|nr:MAG: SusC/RagA family TonB-linked outer membrane protein [Gemmatimonadota bacterium]
MKRLGLKTLLFLSCLLLLPSALIAQEEMRTVTGTVTMRDTQLPLPGTRVNVKGTVIATVTDNRGYFSLRVPMDAELLVFQYLGYRTEEAPVADQVDVMMEIAPVGLEGIVVTAMGVRREKASLGYSVQDLSGDEIAEVPELNIVNSLQGNVAGVHVTNAGPTGGSSRVTIRGANSITGQNQPLFIVDGVPLDNTATYADWYEADAQDGLDFGAQNTGYGGLDFGNAIQDLDPANIENISVLKGPNAAALYGSRAANGAVVITTKSGRGTPAGQLGVTVTISGTAETPLRLPDYQNLYGQGYFGEFEWVDGAGAGTYDYFDESWGPRLDGRLIDQFTGPNQPWVAHPDNVSDFFRTGGTLNTNVAVSHAGESHHVRMALSDTRLNSTAPGSSIHRVGLALKGGVGITDRLSADASLNYIDNSGENRMGTGYDANNPMQQFIWFGRQVDTEALRQYRCEGGGPGVDPEDPPREPTPCIVDGQYNWNYNYHNNPFWEMVVNGNNDDRDRLFFNASVTYQLTDWVNVTGQVGRDWYRFHAQHRIAPYSLDDAGDGSFREVTDYRAETNWDLILTGARQLTSDLSLDVTLGGSIRKNMYEGSGVTVTRLIASPTPTYSIDNAAVTPLPWDLKSEREVRGLYGALSLNYKGWLNLDLTGRNDWSSTLPENENSYFYPSVSSSFLFSEAFDILSSVFSSGKVRASWTRVGNDAEPYQLQSVMTAAVPWAGQAMFSVPNRLANENLKPEETEAWEVGTDLGFFDERLGFVLTHYQSATRNQIMGVQISRASGYTDEMLNAGKVENWGWELLLRANPLRSSTGLNWDLTVNWSTNDSEVKQLPEGIETLVIGGSTRKDYWSVNTEARLGEPYGVLFGNPVLRCGVTEDAAYDALCAGNDGLPILDEDGNTQVDPVRGILGNYNPDWVGGIQNRFSWGAWDLSILFQGQWGGDIFSVTDYFGKYAGVLESTIPGRENDWDDPQVLVRGVFDNGTTYEGQINGEDGVEVRLLAQTYYEGIWAKHSESILDATYLKLRELRIGYELPSNWVRWMGFNGGNFSLIGRNLFLWSKCDNIDPETAFDSTNRQGLEFGQHPSSRSYGFSLTLW